MPENKYYLFFELLATPLRMNIIELLKEKGQMNVTDICSHLKEEQSKVSHNLKKLALCNVVQVKKEKNFRYYELNKETILPLLELIDKHATCSCTVCHLMHHRKKCQSSKK